VIPFLPLALKFWKPLAGVLIVGLVLLAAYHWSYERGVEATEGHYKPLILAAALAKARAEERTRTLETASERLTAEQEARHAEALKAIDSRAADYQRRYAHLLRQYNANRNGGQMPAVPGSPSLAPESTGSDERIERASASLSDTARRCERDAERLAGWVSWYRKQAALMNGGLVSEGR